MNLFRVSAQPMGVDRMAEFLENNYICIGWPGIGNLENRSEAEVRQSLEQGYAVASKELADALQSVMLFAASMQDGDYVLLHSGGWAHLGDLGDYFYEEDYDAPEDCRCHRRGVTWLRSLLVSELNQPVQDWLETAGEVSRYSGPLPPARLDLWLAGALPPGEQPKQKPVQVDEATLAEAIEVLTAALRCEDVERRERAAAALLNYAR
ncbi:hypothetical protein [Paenibacillus donghaensis]|uniref:Uncharacterized protein n=1 Tax=Paenibacillus donghaensis TaxID=414771 RepID=A0A2Z2K792_9BACL|nr:hypothetical protein [Paenibacillus donghaensis]ASA20857.1 hypothetical protein B9T62_08725 [Paenibacillus donghaensis]